MRLKDITILSPSYSGKVNAQEVSFVPMECLRNDSIGNMSISLNEAKGKYTFFGEGDVLIAKVTPCFENGNIAVAKNLKNKIGFGSSEIFVLRPTKKIDKEYLFYLAQTKHFSDEACATMCGVGGLKRISPLFMKTFEITLPEYGIQEKTVQYLKEKIEKINTKISLLNQKQEYYLRLKKSLINRTVCHGLNPNAQMKDSGIKIIGQIPKHWQCKRIKDICSYVSRGCTPSYVEDSNFYVMNQATFSKGYIDISNIRFTDSYRKEAKLLKGDLIMASTGGGVLGKVLYFDNTEGNFIADSHVTIFRDKENCMKYYFYLFSTQYDMINECLAKGSTNQTELQRDKVLALELPYPPLAEQEAIANYLDDKCSKIDTIVEKISEEINLLGKLKKSLINEVITGKRTV